MYFTKNIHWSVSLIVLPLLKTNLIPGWTFPFREDMQGWREHAWISFDSVGRAIRESWSIEMMKIASNYCSCTVCEYRENVYNASCQGQIIDYILYSFSRFSFSFSSVRSRRVSNDHVCQCAEEVHRHCLSVINIQTEYLS